MALRSPLTGNQREDSTGNEDALANKRPTSDDEDEEEDNWQSKAWDLFSKTAVRGLITVEAFVQFAVELNVDCEASAVARLMKQEKMEEISFRNAIRLLEAIPSTVFADDQLDQTSDRDAAVNIIVVNPLEYAWRVWFCGAAEPGKEYTVSSTFKCSPQFWLLFNASLVFMIVSAAITTFISLFWLQNALDREGTNLKSLQETLALFSNAIASVSLQVSGRDLEDQVVTLSRWLERIWHHRDVALVAQSEMELAEDSQMILSVAALVANKSVEQMEVFLRQVDLSAVAAMPTTFMVAVVLDWAQENMYEAHVHDFVSGRAIASTVANARHGFSVSLPVGFEAPCVAAMKDMTTTASGVLDGPKGLDGVDGSVSTWRRFPALNISICISANPHARHHRVRSEVRRLVEDFNKIDVAGNRSMAPREYVLFHDVVVDSRVFTPLNQTTFGISSTPLYGDRVCSLSHAGSAVHHRCTEPFADLMDCLSKRCVMAHYESSAHYTGRLASLVAFYVPQADAVVGVSLLKEAMAANFEKFLVDSANKMNSEFVQTTEIVFAVRDAMDHINPQVTTFRFVDSCLVPCQRVYEGNAPMYAAFSSQASGVSLHPDYTLRPVVGSYSLMKMGSFDVGVMIERDVAELRSISLGLIVDSLNTINSHVSGSTEMIVFQRDGMPSTATFDVNESCPEFKTCITHPTLGMIWREDCLDCVRRPELSTVAPRFMTNLRFVDRCAGSAQCPNSSGVLPDVNRDLIDEAIASPSETLWEQMGLDYSGTRVLSFLSYIRNYSAYIMVKKDYSEIVTPIITSITIYISLSVVFVFFGVIGLVFLTRRTLNRIEVEWRSYKESIESEKVRFDAMIREIVPATVFQRFQRGQRAVTENHSALSFCYINICNFSEIFKDMSPKQVVRMIAYYFTLYDTVAQKMKVFRLRSFGDCSVFIAGLLSNKDFASQSAFTMAKFAGYIAQLLTPHFSHYPHRVPLVAEGYTADPDFDDSKPVKMFPVRIGLHSGGAASGLIDYGKTPFFEVYGPSLSLTHRMMSAAAPSRVHVSTNFKELLEIADTTGVFEFDAMRKMVIRGSGTVSSYPLRSINLPVDEVVLHRLKIEYAQSMHNFRLSPANMVAGRAGSHVDSEGSSLIDKQTTSGDSEDHAAKSGDDSGDGSSNNNNNNNPGGRERHSDSASSKSTES